MKKMKKCFFGVMVILLLITFLESDNSVYAKDKRVKIDTIKDHWIIKEVKKYDYDDNGYLNEKELKKVKILDLESDKGPIDVKHIGKLKYLESLKINNCCPQIVKNIKAIYKLSNLEKLDLVSCIVKKNTKLDLKNLKKLNDLRVSGVSNLKSVNISKNKRLYDLTVASSDIEKLDLRKNQNLKSLHIYGSNNLKTINLKKNKQLKEITLGTIKSKYSLKYNQKLTKLNIDEAEVPDISKNKELRVLNCFYPKTNVSIGSNNKKITKIDICVSEKFPLKFSVNGCKKIKKINLWGYGTFSEIKVKNCGKVKKFELVDCKVDSIKCDIVQDVYMYRVNISDEILANSKVNVINSIN